MDISGDLNKFWLSNSLKISPIEQIEFLQKLINNKLPTNYKSCKITKNLLFIKKLPNNWNLYVKTGNFSTRSGLQAGWFVGWIEKKNKKIIFINHIRGTAKKTTFARV